MKPQLNIRLLHLPLTISPWLFPGSWRWAHTRRAASRSDESQKARGSWPRLQAPAEQPALEIMYHGTMGNPPGWHHHLSLLLLRYRLSRITHKSLYYCIRTIFMLDIVHLKNMFLPEEELDPWASGDWRKRSKGMWDGCCVNGGSLQRTEGVL